MKLVILGASGGCGRWATRLAVQRGHDVRIVVRASAKGVPDEDVEVITGSVLDRATLEEAIRGADALVSCLGLRRRAPWNPWSEVTSPPDLTASVTGMLVDLMTRDGIARLVAISAGGVGDSADRVHPVNRWLFQNSNISVAYRDLEAMEQILQASSLDWHTVRPTTLTNGACTDDVRAVRSYGLLTRVSRADVAAWMLDQLATGEPSPAGRTPMIASRGLFGRA